MNKKQMIKLISKALTDTLTEAELVELEKRLMRGEWMGIFEDAVADAIINRAVRIAKKQDEELKPCQH